MDSASTAPAGNATLTSISMLPTIPPHVAVMTTLPLATPVTTPASETVAIAGVLEAHVNVASLPTASGYAFAVNCNVEPISTEDLPSAPVISTYLICVASIEWITPLETVSCVVLYFVTLEKICHERLKILEKTHKIP